MLSQLLDRALKEADQRWAILSVQLSLAQVIALGAILLYCCWRLWKFTIRPFLRPEEPCEYPYLVPLLGHGLEFFKDSNALIERALNYFGRTHEPFTIQVGPERIYIVTSPEDVTEVYKRAHALEWAGHLDFCLNNLGCTLEGIKLGRTKPGQGDVPLIHDDPVNPRQLSLIPFIEKTHHKQLLSGPPMDKLSRIFIDSLLRSTNPENTAFFDIYIQKVPSGRRVISLKRLCEYCIIQAGIDSFFGSKLLQIDPGLIDKMVMFNAKSWMLLYGLPAYFAKAVKIPQRALMESFKTFLKLPEWQRQDQSWVVQQVLTVEENINLDLESRAAILLMILWASTANIYAITFWTLAHILVDKGLREAVQHETSAAWAASGHLDIKMLTSACPLLNNVFLECLRTKSGAMTGRRVRQATRIGNTTLQPGSSVLIPSQQLHSNEKVWGPTSDRFDAARFCCDSNLAKHASFRPFGGGVSICPGRQIAKAEAFSLVAIMLRRFNVHVSKEIPYRFPRLDHSQPVLGITGPEPGMDIWLDVEDRPLSFAS